MSGEQGDWADRAASVMAEMGRRTAGQLRMLAPQPFGLVNDQLTLPVFVGSYTQGGPTEDLPRVQRGGMPPPITSMTLCYGAPEDARSPYVEVFTAFTVQRGGDNVSLRNALGRAASNEDARLTGELEHTGPVDPPGGPMERDSLEIVVAGQSRTVRTQKHRDFHGLQFTHSGLLVQAIARQAWPDQPEFAVVTELAPFLAAMETGDPEVIKTRLRARYPHGPPRPGR